MTETKLFHIPARIADLGFSVSLPADWVSHALPDETIDFENPTAMVALAIVTHPAAAIVFSVGARPAYGDGVLLNWAHYLLQASELKPQAIGPEEVAGVPAQVGQASQQSDLGEMLVRFAFLEDGGRLINISLTAPEGLAGAVQEVWFDALASFQLAAPKGATPPAPASEESAPKVENGGDPEEMATYALADDAASLSPDEAINANLRDRGIGLVPRVVATDDASKTATVGAGAILAQFDLPYGWHVIDDGKRTLVFEPKGEVQISLNLIPLDGHDFQGVLDEIEAQMRRDYPAPEFMRLSEAPIEALGARNIKDGDEEIEQYHLLIPGPSADMALRARVTTVPQRNREAGNLAELILKSAVFGSFSEPKGAPDSDGPAWWQKAKALEADGDLEGAEKTIRQAVDHLGAFASIAQLYLERMVRLKEEGDAAGAADAFQRAESWIYSYAGGATSGGEGAALSLERDDFMAELKAAFEA